jgi:nitrate reductase beta subunit
LKFFASLFSAGNIDVIEGVMRKLMAVRYFQRSKDADETSSEMVSKILREAGLTPEEADAIYELTALCGPAERYVMPPIQREEAMAGAGGDCAPEMCKGSCGLGPTKPPVRGA